MLSASSLEDLLVPLRDAMVRRQLAARGVRDPRVLAAFAQVPRERFVPPALAERAYEDGALPIGGEQTISQPYVVAVMTEALRLTPKARVLEIGAGSGYGAAILGQLAAEVHTIERVPELAARAAAALADFGHDNVHVHQGDGARGLPEHAPYDAISVTAASPEVPSELLDQLAPGGRLVLPLGDPTGTQVLLLVERGTGAHADAFTERELLPVRFVPLIRG